MSNKKIPKEIKRVLSSTVARIYLLVRVSDKKTLRDRVEKEIFGNRLFETLRAKFVNEQEFYEKVVQKVVPIAGDVALERLGLSDQDLEMIQRDTKVLIHCAAAVTFTCPLSFVLEVEVAFHMPFLMFA